MAILTTMGRSAPFLLSGQLSLVKPVAGDAIAPQNLRTRAMMFCPRKFLSVLSFWPSGICAGQRVTANRGTSTVRRYANDKNHLFDRRQLPLIPTFFTFYITYSSSPELRFCRVNLLMVQIATDRKSRWI